MKIRATRERPSLISCLLKGEARSTAQKCHDQEDAPQKMVITDWAHNQEGIN